MLLGMGGLKAANAIDIVERAYDVSGSEADWLRGVIDGAWGDLDFGNGVYAFTDEPSLLLDGRFGVRIEDVVVCAAGGGRRLNGLDAGPLPAD